MRVIRREHAAPERMAREKLPKHLRIMDFVPKPKPVRPKSAASPSQLTDHTQLPLAMDLHNAGLGHYARKLCDDMSASTVEQILALDRLKYDALIDALRPLPGHRVRLQQFFSEKRAAAAAAADAPAADEAATQRPQSAASAAQRKQWRATVGNLSKVSRRGKDGPFANAAQQQHATPAGDPTMVDRQPCRVHVIKLAGGGRGSEYCKDGPRVICDGGG